MRLIITNNPFYNQKVPTLNPESVKKKLFLNTVKGNNWKLKKVFLKPFPYFTDIFENFDFLGALWSRIRSPSGIFSIFSSQFLKMREIQQFSKWPGDHQTRWVSRSLIDATLRFFSNFSYLHKWVFLLFQKNFFSIFFLVGRKKKMPNEIWPGGRGRLEKDF